MQSTPLSMRKHIAIFGNTNAGKSTLFNALLGQEMAIVSDVRGTTTDPVTKAMELIPYGPVALIDTAGLNDDTELGTQRAEKTSDILKRSDLILYTVDLTELQRTPDPKSSRPVIVVLTKADLVDAEALSAAKKRFPEAVAYRPDDPKTVETLKQRMITALQKQQRDDETLLGDLLPQGSQVVLVTPIDEEAPKGRLILPQIQVLRDCLDHDMRAYVTKETTLRSALQEINHADLVVTDSQAFQIVNEIVPPEVPLTSFSMLLARQKGNFMQLLHGAETIKNLKDGDRILMMEGCTHNSNHADIGRVKLPRLLEKRTGARLDYTYFTGYQFPDDLADYALAIQCGMCMINKQEVASRLSRFQAEGLPVTNYGMVLAALNGILDRAKQIFMKESAGAAHAETGAYRAD